MIIEPKTTRQDETMAEEKEVIDDAEVESKRVARLTERAMENKLNNLIGARRGLLAQITCKRSEL